MDIEYNRTQIRVQGGRRMSFLKQLLCRHKVKRVVGNFDFEYKPGKSGTKLVLVCLKCERAFIKWKRITMQEVDQITREHFVPEIKRQIEKRNVLLERFQRSPDETVGANGLLGDGAYIDIPSHYGSEGLD